jgi:hypothetical protein
MFKLTSDELLSTFTVEFKLRRYTGGPEGAAAVAAAGVADAIPRMMNVAANGFEPLPPEVTAALAQLLEHLWAAEHWRKAEAAVTPSLGDLLARSEAAMVGRCRFTVSKPVLTLDSAYGFSA